MTASAIIALATTAGVGVTALIVAYLLARLVAVPWQRAADAGARAAAAEVERDHARLREQEMATRLADEQAEVRRLRDAISEEIPVVVDGTDGLQELAGADDARAAGRADAAPGVGGGPEPAVPRVTAPGSVAGNPLVPVRPH